jgi:hypothetical protein
VVVYKLKGAEKGEKWELGFLIWVGLLGEVYVGFMHVCCFYWLLLRGSEMSYICVNDI